MRTRTIAYSLVALTVAFLSCTTAKKMTLNSKPEHDLPSFDWQGHRGCRGLMPENTIPAMRKAIDLGVTTLEMDVVISKDHKVVVSHDPYFSENITTTPGGTYLTKKEAAQHLLYQMPYDSIKKYDVGMKPFPDYPRQQKIKAVKPLLSELIQDAEAYARSKGRTIHYNIEIKSKEGFDGLRHPGPETFSGLVLQVVRSQGILERTTIQSFDVRPLQYIHKTYPEVTLSYLVENNGVPFDDQLKKLGFIPQIYSPHAALVTPAIVRQCHEKGMKVIPWTVNTAEGIKTLKDMGIDGIISDYPDLFAQFLNPK